MRKIWYWSMVILPLALFGWTLGYTHYHPTKKPDRQVGSWYDADFIGPVEESLGVNHMLNNSSGPGFWVDGHAAPERSEIYINGSMNITEIPVKFRQLEGQIKDLQQLNKEFLKTIQLLTRNQHLITQRLPLGTMPTEHTRDAWTETLTHAEFTGVPTLSDTRLQKAVIGDAASSLLNPRKPLTAEVFSTGPTTSTLTLSPRIFIDGPLWTRDLFRALADGWIPEGVVRTETLKDGRNMVTYETHASMQHRKDLRDAIRLDRDLCQPRTPPNSRIVSVACVESGQHIDQLLEEDQHR